MFRGLGFQVSFRDSIGRFNTWLNWVLPDTWDTSNTWDTRYTRTPGPGLGFRV